MHSLREMRPIRTFLDRNLPTTAGDTSGRIEKLTPGSVFLFCFQATTCNNVNGREKMARPFLEGLHSTRSPVEKSQPQGIGSDAN